MVDARRLAEELRPLVGRRHEQRDLGHVLASLDALWALTIRNVTQASRGTPGPGALMFKLAYSEARDRLGELSMRVLGRGAFDGRDARVEERLRTLSLPIAAGTSQIQRNIIGERILGLPKEQPWP